MPNKSMKTIIASLFLMLIPVLTMGHSDFSSTNYIGVDDVISSGGGESTSTNYNQLSSIGQNSQGTLSSGNYFLHAGFLHPPLPTITPTITPTATITMTASPTFTITETFVVTSTPTATNTPEHTITSSPTITITSTVSATLTESATCTHTCTPTVTATFTPTSTISTTLTATLTLTITPTSTEWDGDDMIFYPQPGIIGKPAWFLLKIKSSKSCEVKISIYNINGEKTGALNGICHTGINAMPFDNSHMSPGLYYYICCLDGSKKEIKKMVLIK